MKVVGFLACEFLIRNHISLLKIMLFCRFLAGNFCVCVCLLSNLIPSKVPTWKELKCLLWVNTTCGEILVWKMESSETLKRPVVDFWCVLVSQQKNMEMDVVLSFFSTITNVTPDGIEWVEGVSDQRKSMSFCIQCESFMSLKSLSSSKTKSSISEYLILGQSHSALSHSPAITSSPDHDARALYKIIISTFFTKIYSSKHLNSC